MKSLALQGDVFDDQVNFTMFKDSTYILVKQLAQVIGPQMVFKGVGIVSKSASFWELGC